MLNSVAKRRSALRYKYRTLAGSAVLGTRYICNVSTLRVNYTHYYVCTYTCTCTYLFLWFP